MPREEAAQHLDRCIKSGLWVPNAKDAEGDDEGEEAANEDEASSNTAQVTEDVEKLQMGQ